MTRYPCHNHKPHGGDFGWHPVQDGWTWDGRKQMRRVHAVFAPVECGHHPSPGPDPQCDGCKWRTDHAVE